MRTEVLIALVVLAFSPGRAAGSEAMQRDLALMQGEWSIVSGDSDGRPIPAEMLSQMKRICTGNEITALVGGQVYFKAKVTIDPSKMPKTIDYEMTEGFTKGRRQLGIYEIDSGTLRSCFAAPERERPADFTSQPGERRTLTLWKRDQPASAAASHPPGSVSVTNLVSPDEPGERLVVYGTVFGPDGTTALTNAAIRIYHTDASGVYSPDANDDSNPRLQASLRTGSDGSYEVRTIRPGPYPGGTTPAHVHLIVSAPGYQEQDAMFFFAGDPILTSADHEKYGGNGRFSSIRTVEPGPDGTRRCRRDIQLVKTQP
jgi:uncharacterized protein (TIGR03067 family)